MAALYGVLHFMGFPELRTHGDCAVFWPVSGSSASNVVHFIFSKEQKRHNLIFAPIGILKLSCQFILMLLH